MQEKMDKMSISQQNVHAWVEIYIDGIGFVPIEVSPEYYDVMPQANLDTGFENSIVRSDFVPENSGGGASTNQVLQIIHHKKKAAFYKL